MSIGKEKRPDFKRGLKEAREQLPLLQKKWPKGFPLDPKLVRPLVVSIAPVIAEEMGWSLVYTRGVLLVWKQRIAYCNAVMKYERRVNLDGTLSDEAVDEVARTAAAETLARIAAKRAKELAKAQAIAAAASEAAAA